MTPPRKAFMQIVQLADIHFLDDPDELLYGTSPDDAFRAVYKHAMASPTTPDAIILSGDQAQDGGIQAYSRLVKAFGENRIPVFAIPGNHDNAKNMDTVFSKAGFLAKPHANIGDWKIELINSQVEGEGYGRIGPTKLAELENTLSSNKASPYLIAIHHTPDSHCATAGCRLQDSQEFLELLRRNPNAKLVIAGHTHRAAETRRHQTCILTAPSVCLQLSHCADRPAANDEDFMRIHSIDINRIGYRAIRLFADGSHETQVHWV